MITAKFFTNSKASRMAWMKLWYRCSEGGIFCDWDGPSSFPDGPGREPRRLEDGEGVDKQRGARRVCQG